MIFSWVSFMLSGVSSSILKEMKIPSLNCYELCRDFEII
jgi:hypothetical protein